MNIKLTTIGGAELSFEVKDEKQAVETMAFWQSLPTFCGICASPVIFSFRQPQGYTYYGLVCTGATKHEANCGQHKDTGTLFFKGDWREVQYNTVQSERDAEISRFNDQPQTGEKAQLIKRISDGNLKIKNLGGQVEKRDYQSMTVKELNTEIEEMMAQYSRLSAANK